MENVPKIILIDKPSGVTSFDCIRRMRSVSGIKKMGHAGTLDPLATGLMVIGIGKGTKMLNDFKNSEKSYEVEALLGERTTTGDTDGEVIEKRRVNLEVVEVKKKVLKLKGEHFLCVPIYSAIKKDGKPLYWYARKGLAVDVPKKKMIVREVKFKDYVRKGDDFFVSFSVTVSSGTYVRSLVEKFGEDMGILATVSALRRNSLGNLSIDDATPLDKLNRGHFLEKTNRKSF